MTLASSPPPTTLGMLRTLPREVRDQIYELTLYESYIITCSCWLERELSDKVVVQPAGRCGQHAANMALTITSKAISSEILETLFAKSVFTMTLQKQHCFIDPIFNKLPGEIKNIKLNLDMDWWSLQMRKHGPSEFRAVCEENIHPFRSDTSKLETFVVKVCYSVYSRETKKSDSHVTTILSEALGLLTNSKLVRLEFKFKKRIPHRSLIAGLFDVESMMKQLSCQLESSLGPVTSTDEPGSSTSILEFRPRDFRTSKDTH